MDIALLIVRLIIGLGLAAHGAQKLFGWFGGYGTQGTGQFLASLGFVGGVQYAVLAGMGEFFGGLFIALGLFGPAGPGLIIAVMVVAIGSVHLHKGFFNATGGWELPIYVIAACVLLAFTGPGMYSVDATQGWLWLSFADVAWRAIGIGIAFGLTVLLLRKRPPVAV